MAPTNCFFKNTRAQTRKSLLESN